jgi:hypothetical protein
MLWDVFFVLPSLEVGTVFYQLALHCYFYVVISFRLPDVTSSVSNAEAVFRRTQFKTHDNVETALKLEVKERSLDLKKQEARKVILWYCFFLYSQKRCGKIFASQNTYFHISDSFSHFELNF